MSSDQNEKGNEGESNQTKRKKVRRKGGVAAETTADVNQ